MFDSVQLSSSKNSRSKQHFCVNYQRPMALCVYVLGCLMTHNFFYWKSNANLGNSVVMWNMAHSPTYEQQQSEWSELKTRKSDGRDCMGEREKKNAISEKFMVAFDVVHIFIVVSVVDDNDERRRRCHSMPHDSVPSITPFHVVGALNKMVLRIREK